MATIITKDALRSSVEAATGGLCTVLYDDKGHPSFMRRIPKMRIEDLYPDLGMTGTHPAFIVNGVEKSELFIGMYPASLVDSYAVSLPGMDPANYLSFDSAVSYCKNKGTGWHLMTNVEWALLGALGIKTGFQPRGNTYWGQHHEAKHETGTLAPGASGLGVVTDDLHGRTLTGSGPVSWRHDNSPAGIADLVGNVWEWTGGMRLNAGEINIIKDNDAAAHDVDMSAESSVTVPALLKLLSLYPVDTTNPVGSIWMRNSAERLALRGGSYNRSSGAGLFGLDLACYRSHRTRRVGFRPAFIL